LLALESGVAAVNFAAEGVKKDMGKGGAGVIVFKQSTKIVSWKRDDVHTPDGTLVWR